MGKCNITVFTLTSGKCNGSNNVLERYRGKVRNKQVIKKGYSLDKCYYCGNNLKVGDKVVSQKNSYGCKLRHYSCAKTVGIV